MKRFRIVVAGCGSMANSWVNYVNTRLDAEIVALVDISYENARKLSEQHGLNCGIYNDLREAVNTSGANLVFDVTIPDAHKNIVTTALELGCDVFGEKPMSSNWDDAKYMLEVAKKRKRSYAVMQNRRYLKNIRALRAILEKSEIGEVGYIGADFFLGPHFGGFRDIMDSPLLLDMSIHTFDQARFITGCDPVSVYCHEYNPPGSWYRGNASAICIFEFTNSLVFCYRGSWCAEGCNTSWESEWRITGSKGTILWDGNNPPVGEVVIKDKKARFINEFRPVEVNFVWNGNEGHFGCLEEMFDALITGRKAETDCSDNIKSMAMVFGAVKSAKEKKKILLT